MATKKVRFDGHIFDKRTGDMLKEVQKRFGKRLDVIQGSYNNGKYSAGTHSGGGAVDLGIPYSGKDSLRLLKIMREVGFAAWIRDSRDGFGRHIHGIAIGAPELGSVAKGQIKDYKAKPQRNGLKGHAKDRYSYLKVPVRTWEQYLKLKKKSTFPLPWNRSFGYPAAEKGLTRRLAVDGRGGYSRYSPYIKRLQKKLGVEPVGVFGPKTRHQVKYAQKKRGLPQTGLVNKDLWNRLGL
jgi:peptidoglycan hydrolase-like protein with peptidoglycan-binding domain